MLDAAEWGHDRAGAGAAAAGEDRDVAGRAFEDDREFVLRGVDEDQVDVVLPGEQDDVGARLGRRVCGDAGRDASPAELAPARRQHRVLGRHVLAILQQPDEQELAGRAARERLRDQDQLVETVEVAGDGHDRAPARPSVGTGQSGILAQDRLLELLQAHARLDPEFVHEQRPRTPVDLERLRLSAGAVERPHQRRSERLPVGVLAHEGLQLGDQFGVPAQFQIGLQPTLERSQAKLLKAEDLGLEERLRGEVCERGPPPQRERVSQERRRLRGRGRSGLLDEPLEAKQVELIGGDLQEVPVLTRDDRLARRNRLAQAGDVVLERVRRRPRRAGAPELVDQAVGRDHLVRMREQDREERPLACAAECEPAPVVCNLQRAEDPELHVVAGSSARAQWSLSGSAHPPKAGSVNRHEDKRILCRRAAKS